MKLIDKLHQAWVPDRRAGILSHRLAALLPQGGRVLDVGCGDGRVASAIQQIRPDVRIEGVDVLVQPSPRIPVQQFDGVRLPFDDGSCDAVMFVDVLHHTDDPGVLLAEARRVSRDAIVIKDHLREGILAGPTLRFMDYVGNHRFGVRLPYNYWRRKQWTDEFSKLRLGIESWDENLRLYVWPLSIFFGRSLHFIARMNVPGSA